MTGWKKSHHWFTVYDHLYGKHSRIPHCCRAFYRREWPREVMLRTPYFNLCYQYLQWGYVPCPRCVAQRNQVSIRICEKSCEADYECRDRIEKALQKYLISGRLTR